MNTKTTEAQKISRNASGNCVYSTDLIGHVDGHYLVTKAKCRVSIAEARPDDVPHEGHGWAPATGVHRTVLFALDVANTLQLLMTSKKQDIKDRRKERTDGVKKKERRKEINSKTEGGMKKEGN